MGGRGGVCLWGGSIGGLVVMTHLVFGQVRVGESGSSVSSVSFWMSFVWKRVIYCLGGRVGKNEALSHLRSVERTPDLRVYEVGRFRKAPTLGHLEQE